MNPGGKIPGPGEDPPCKGENERAPGPVPSASREATTGLHPNAGDTPRDASSTCEREGEPGVHGHLDGEAADERNRGFSGAGSETGTGPARWLPYFGRN